MAQPGLWGSWLRQAPSTGMCLRLFCFPYAGGASVFHTWPDYLPSGVQLCLLQLPGREDRLMEKPFVHMQPLVKQLAELLAPEVGDFPFAFLGHRMGP